MEISLLADDNLNFVNVQIDLYSERQSFPILTVTIGLNIVKDRSNKETDHVVERTFGWLIGAPIIVLVGVWLLVSAYRWFSTLPSWAAVVIALLVVLPLHR